MKEKILSLYHGSSFTTSDIAEKLHIPRDYVVKVIGEDFHAETPKNNDPYADLYIGYDWKHPFSNANRKWSER